VACIIPTINFNDIQQLDRVVPSEEVRSYPANG